MDFITLTEQGNNSALVFCDKFSRWVEVKPAPVQSASFTCICLFECICTYGMPSLVCCDQGKHINAEEVKVILSNYGIDLKFGIAYRPQGQGKVVRMSGAIKSIIKKYIFEYQ